MATPHKTLSRLCCLCGSASHHHLINLGNNKALKASYAEAIEVCLDIVIPEDVKALTYICGPCGQKLFNFKSFKINSRNHFDSREVNVMRTKREHFTPVSDKKLVKRTKATTTADRIAQSAEKFKKPESHKALPKKSGKRLAFSSKKQSTEPSRDDFRDYATPFVFPTTSPSSLIIKANGHIDSSSPLVRTDDHIYALPTDSSPPLVEIHDHIYALPTDRSLESVKQQAMHVMKDSGLTGLSRKRIPKLSVADVKKIVSALQEESLERASFEIFKCLPLISEIKTLILKDLEAGMSTRFKKNSSQLYARSPEQLSNNDIFSAVIMEVKKHTPFLLDVLTICCKSKTDEQRLTMISTIFGMFMQSRNHMASAIQRLYTSLCIRFHADNELLNRLNIIHLTLTGSSKTVIIKEFADHHRNEIINEVKSGKDGKINGDNLDIKVTPSYERLQSKRQDLHFFASDWTPDRIDVSNLASTGSCGNPNSVTVQNFTVTQKELNQFRDSTKLLVGHEMVKNFDCFQWMRNLLVDHIPHEYSDEMCRVSTPYIMPILLKNETKYTDCIGIMDSYEKQAKEWYQKAGRG